MLRHTFRNPELAALAAVAARTGATMAVPSDVQVKNMGLPQSELEALRLQVSNLTASFRLLTTKMDADVGVTDTNYNALITDDAVATAPKKVTTL